MSQELKINLASGVEAQLVELNKTLSEYLPRLVEVLSAKHPTTRLADKPKPEPFVAPAEILPVEAPKTEEVTKQETTEPTPAVVESVESVESEAPNVSMDQIKKAAMDLLDNGLVAQLQTIPVKYGLSGILEATPDLYNAIAADLRALGGDI